MSARPATVRRVVAPAIDSVEPGARIFVWGVWAALLVFDLGLVARFGPDVPIGDDFDVVSVRLRGATRDARVALVSAQRAPRPAAAADSAGPLPSERQRLPGGDVLERPGPGRPGRRDARGRRPPPRRGPLLDAVFPLLLLGPGHYVNLLWSWQVPFVLGTVLIGGVLLLIVARPGWPGPGSGRCGRGALAALPLCGANGLALVPALALWLLAAVAAHVKSGRPDGRRTGLLVLAATLPALLLAGLYLSGYHRAEHHPAPPGVAEASGTSLQFLSLISGPRRGPSGRPRGSWHWPWWRAVRFWLRGSHCSARPRSVPVRWDWPASSRPSACSS